MTSLLVNWLTTASYFCMCPYSTCTSLHLICSHVCPSSSHHPSIIKDIYIGPELGSWIRLLSKLLLFRTHPPYLSYICPIPLSICFWWRPSINKESVLSFLFPLLLYYLFNHPSTVMVKRYGLWIGKEQLQPSSLIKAETSFWKTCGNMYSTSTLLSIICFKYLNQNLSDT